MRQALKSRLLGGLLLLGASVQAVIPLPAAAAEYPCTLTGVQSAITTGGDATFACAAPTDVVINQTFTISKDVNLNGGGLLTLKRQAGFNNQLFIVQNTRTLSLNNLNIIDFASNIGGAVALVDSTGTLNVDTVTFSNNKANGTIPGGVFYLQGRGNIINATFLNNSTGGSGGAIYVTSTGSLFVRNSTFDNNQSITNGTGGAISARGPVSVYNSTFKNNTTTPATNRIGTGGAIHATAPITIGMSTFDTNSSSEGGALSIGDGGLITRTTFFSNLATRGSITNTVTAESYGGAIVVTGNVNIDASYFYSNTARATGFSGGALGFGGPALAEGGAIYSGIGALGTITVSNSSFMTNTSAATGGIGFGGGGLGTAHGGAVYVGNFSMPFSMTHSSVAYNSSLGTGGNGQPAGTNPASAVSSGGGVFSYSMSTTVTNSTIAGNLSRAVAGGPTASSATAEGGGISIEGAGYGYLRYNTIANNRAEADNGMAQNTDGAGVNLGGNNSPTQLTGNIILQNVIQPANIVRNCSTEAPALFTSLGSNVANDITCKLTQPSDQVATFAQINVAPLANNGGPAIGSTSIPGVMPTHQLNAGSVAINTATINCPATDQRGATRPGGGACDKGSIESDGVAPVAFKTFVPVAVTWGNSGW